MNFKRIAIDTSKNVFTLHGVDDQERAILRRELKRGQVETFFDKQDATEVVLEACGGSHHWARVLSQLGHRVRLIPPQYVKPFVKRAKNDRNDAEAISEAASRPSMRSVAIKTIDQQADGIILKHREMLIGQRTQSINALRGHAAEFGVVAAKGTCKVAVLLATLAADNAIRQLRAPCSSKWVVSSRPSMSGWLWWMRSWPRRTRPILSADCWRKSLGWAHSGR